MMNLDRWNKLTASLGLPLSNECFNALVLAYSENHRHYHNVKHIEAMLKHFDKVRDLSGYPDELELAIWFHDAIYKPFSSSNEYDSAVWAKNFLITDGYNACGVDRVFNLIMATLHNGKAKEQDEKLIVDIDLSILGTPASVYGDFEKNVRKEYRFVPWFVYRKKRKEILGMFLDMSRIYHTDYFYDKYEAVARVNLEQAFAGL